MERSSAALNRADVLPYVEHGNMPRPETSPRLGDILILTSATGAGHDSVAAALREALHEADPQVGARILDPLSGETSNGPLSPGRLYDATAAHAPWLWGLVYHMTNNAWTVRLGMAAGSVLWTRRIRSAIQAERPGMVVSVHPLCTHLAADILRTLPAAPPLHCVVTDLVTIHQCWACDAADAFYVATPRARDALIAMDIPPKQVRVTGLPLRASFARAHRTATDATPRILLFGGGRPSRRIEKVARALAASRLPFRLIVVCGRDTRLRRRLTRTLGARATVLGWRDDIAALIRWSSVVVTKGGPTAVAEVLSQARPMVISHVLPGQEGGNVTLVSRIGSGSYIPDVDTLVRRVGAHSAVGSIGDTAQAAWWGSAAGRVADHLLAARIESPTAPHEEVPASSGRVIDNPISGERIIIRESGAQTAGRLLSFDLFLPPGGHVPARHAHPVQEERFTVIAGRMRFRLGRRTILATPGDTVHVPAGTAHWFGNAGSGISHARVEVRPALRMEELFAEAAAIGRAGHIPGTRLPRLSDLARFMIEFQRELAVPDVPAFLVRALLAPLARLGRRRGDAAP